MSILSLAFMIAPYFLLIGQGIDSYFALCLFFKLFEFNNFHFPRPGPCHITHLCTFSSKSFTWPPETQPTMINILCLWYANIWANPLICWDMQVQTVQWDLHVGWCFLKWMDCFNCSQAQLAKCSLYFVETILSWY